MTTEELEQMRKVIREENEAVEKRLSEKIEGVDAKIDATKQEIMATMEKDAEDNAGFFHKTGELIEKHLTPRIEQIEDHLGLTDPTKNN